MSDRHQRTRALIGEKGLTKLLHSSVLICGVGGVGSFCVEALARAGVGHLTLLDDAYVTQSNLNRQIQATEETVGQLKVNALKDRIYRINSEIVVDTLPIRFTGDSDQLDYKSYDYIVDAIDSLKEKVDLLCKAIDHCVPVISCLGAGNKLDPTSFVVADISNTHTCPLAKNVRISLRKKGIRKGIKAIFSTEKPISKEGDVSGNLEFYGMDKRRIISSISFVPSVMGLISAGEVVRDLIEIKRF